MVVVGIVSSKFHDRQASVWARSEHGVLASLAVTLLEVAPRDKRSCRCLSGAKGVRLDAPATTCHVQPQMRQNTICAFVCCG
jgi:hypothetical protein